MSLILLFVAGACGRDVDTSWRSGNGYRWRDLAVPSRGSPGFTLIDSASSGIAFVNTVSDSLLVKNRVLAHGGGVCLGDVTGDGQADIFLARTEGASVLYRNSGALEFEDVTHAAGIATGDRHATGCALADMDGDGDLDLILLALGGPNTLYTNDGSGRFTEARGAGLASTAGSSSVAVADVDGDGWLDAYVTNYKAYTMLDRMSPQERSFDQLVRELGGAERGRFEVKQQHRVEYKVTDRPDLGGVSLSQRADPDAFYRNDRTGNLIREPMAGNRRFTDENGRPLRQEPEDFGLAAMLVDLDGDRAPDLYVANDFEDPDQLWRNDGRGNFRLAPSTALRSTSNSGMAVDVGDVNRDGLPDLFEVDMLSRDTRRLKTQIPTHTATPKFPGQGDTRTQMQRNVLQLNRGDGTFAEVARLAGVGASGWSWSTMFMDVDLDGWEDILIGTGHRWDVMDGDTQYRLRNRLQDIDWRKMLFEYPPLPLPNVAFRNRGDLTFDDASRAWRFELGESVSHGMAAADLDGDGDLDVVINRLGKPAAVLRNDATAPRVAVRLRGSAPNTAGIGSVIRIIGGAVPVQQREIVAGGLYLSSSEPLRTFATGKADSVTIEVDWRDGRRSRVRGARVNRLYEIDQGFAGALTTEGTEVTEESKTNPGSSSASSVPSVVQSLFTDVTSMLGGHTHVEPYFDDFARQLLLPNTLSQLGPGVAWADVDGDGREDLMVGTGREGSLALFRNDGATLKAATTRFPPAATDITTILAFPDGRGGQTILSGVSSYETPNVRDAFGVPGVVQYAPATGALTALVGGDSASVGPLAAADYDGDGNLDLFVGGRVVPQWYPLPASSRLFRNERGRLVPDGTNNRLFSGLGMVSAALFTDLDGNGWPDLVAALEWGPIRVFLNEQGTFRAADMPGLAGVTSRWNGIASGDLDGDGRMDLVATSWGRNLDVTVTRERPLRLYRFRTRRGLDVVMAQYDPRLRAEAPLTSFARLTLAMPSAAMRVRTFAAFADATIEQLLGRDVDRTPLEARTMDHTTFLNRGSRFDATSLPVEAQMAPAFYAGIADFNGDGHEDVFLTQNFFATEIATPRFDAGRSLLLAGEGNGALAAVSGQQSGLLIYGEQRGAAYADFDADGRLDLSVSQNGAATRLFRNVGATPGLRVRLRGPLGNPTGVGVQLRLRYGDRSGPVREVQAGSGYWSQNGAIQVLGRSGTPTALWVRWPGGREQTVPLSPGQSEIIVRSP